jgi:hypothetical protein
MGSKTNKQKQATNSYELIDAMNMIYKVLLNTPVTYNGKDFGRENYFLYLNA